MMMEQVPTAAAVHQSDECHEKNAQMRRIFLFAFTTLAFPGIKRFN